LTAFRLHATACCSSFIPVAGKFRRHLNRSLRFVGGIVLMLGHRLLARPFMECVRPQAASGAGDSAETSRRWRSRARRATSSCCARHAEPTDRFFLAAADRRSCAPAFVPLVALLAALAYAGDREPLERGDLALPLVVGATVNIAAAGSIWRSPRQPLRAVFPLHNFYLLGVRNILWIFRLVGIWWIWVGASFFLG
jgi:hypothetical protein